MALGNTCQKVEPLTWSIEIAKQNFPCAAVAKLAHRCESQLPCQVLGVTTARVKMLLNQINWV